MVIIADKRPPGVMLYEETIKMLHTVPEEQAGRIIKGIASFYVTGEIPTLTEPLEQAVVNSLVDVIEKDAEKYAETCEKNKQNAEIRWNKENQRLPKKKTNGSQDKKPKFTPPTSEEVNAYCLESGYRIDAERFIDYYESNGWMVGRNKMKDWKAAVRNWSKRDDEKPKKEERRDPYEDVDFSWSYNLPQAGG